MAFIPTISYCLVKNDDDEYQLVVTDTTDIYDATDNPTGWEDATTINAANVTVANLVITDPDDVETTISVLDQIPNPVTGQIEFTALDSDNGIAIKDGRYKVIYNITEDGNEYSVCLEKYFYPNIKCCISKLVKSVQENPKDSKYYKDLLKAKAWEKALCSAVNTLDKDKADEILLLLTDFCNYNPCGCN